MFCAQGQESEQDAVQQDEAEAQVQEVSDEEDGDVPPKTLASELAAQLAKRCRAFPESNLQSGDKFSLRAAKSRSMILIDRSVSILFLYSVAGFRGSSIAKPS